jgi:hypothetical protein
VSEQRWLDADGSLPDEVMQALREAPGDPGDAGVDALASELGRTLGMTLPVANIATLPTTQSAAAGALGGHAAVAVAAPSGLGFMTGLFGGVALGVGLSGAVTFGLSAFDDPAPRPAAGGVVTVPGRPAQPRLTPLGDGSSAPVVSSAAPAPLSPAARAKPTAVQAPRAELEPVAVSELALLRRAQTELGLTPARALQLAEEHAARFAGGALEQEREVIAIDALVRLGRRGEATTRAERFRQTFPGSAHERRLDVLLASAKISR